MDKSKREYLSADDLKNRLYHNLRDRGLVDSLKAQLRNNIVSELQHSAKGKLSVRDLKTSEEGTLYQRAANSLIADHLKQCRYEYTRSVFMSECAIPPEKVFTIPDILKLLNISSESALYKKLVNNSGTEDSQRGFLWRLLSELSATLAGSRQDCGVQTDMIKFGPISSLDEKLNSLDSLYSSMKDEQYRTGATSVEERILTHQRKLEERYQSDLKLEVARIKENEISKIRMEENETARKDLERARREMERTYQEKFDSLIVKERNSLERMKAEQEMQEKEIYSQRQSILEEIELVRHRENEVKRETEVNGREKKLMEERVTARGEDLRRRELEVKRMETEFSQRLHNEMTKFKLELQSKFVDRTQNLELRETKVKEGEGNLMEAKDKIQSMKDELHDKAHRVNELQTQVQEMKHQEHSANRHNEFLNAKLRDVSDYNAIREQNAVMRSEMDALRSRLNEVLHVNERERARHDDMVKELRNPELVDSLRDDNRRVQHHKNELEGKLLHESQRNRELHVRYEDQGSQMKEMNREVADLREQLSATQRAMNSDLYQQKDKLRTEDPTYTEASQRTAKAYGQNDENQLSRPAQKKVTADHVFDMDYELDLRPSSRHGAYSDLSGDEQSSADSADIVAETKYRLKSLEKEAVNLEKAYLNFHYNMTNPQALVPEPLQRKLEDIQKDLRSSSQSQHSSHPLGSPGTSPIQDDRPLSSTPYRQRLLPETHDNSFEELSRGSRDKKASSNHLPRFDIGNVSDDAINQQADARVERNRPITMSDLEARPGSPNIMVVPGSQSSTGISPKQAQGMKPQDCGLITPAIPAKLPPLSLDSAWKSSEAGDLDAEKRQKEEEDLRKWEEDRRQREEERKKRDEEAWEKEQQELNQLQGIKQETKKEAPVVEEEQTGGVEIDPVMQQYMQMVQQQKDKEKKVLKNAIGTWSKGKAGGDKTSQESENDISVADSVKSSDGSGDSFKW